MCCCVGWRHCAARCVTPIRTTQTSQKLPTASVSLSWSASARLTKRHLARPHRPLSNAFPECDSRLREFSPFLHSWRENPRLSLALAKAMWSEAKAGNIPLPARDAGDPRREIHEARKRNPERGRVGLSSVYAQLGAAAPKNDPDADRHAFGYRGDH